jgi:16S rRNA processing protein RimM
MTSAGAPALVVIGKVLGAHSTSGELRVRWLGDGPRNLMRARRIAFGPSAADPALRWHEVKRVAPGRDREVRAEVEGIETREAAAALAGLFAIVDRAELEPLPPGEHYWFEWIGCAVEASDGRALGTVRELWDAGAHDVLVVEDTTGRELLLPVAQALLRDVDMERRRIVIDVPDGLLETA